MIVLKELMVDFDNLATNGCDFKEELKAQGWENYFQRLHGPVYEALVIDLWKDVDCDDFHIVSDVIRQRIIITEESIAKLLGLKFLKGKQVYGLDNKSKEEKKSLD